MHRPILDGKVAIVTGCGTGLGKAMALALARAGADIVGGARRLELLERTAAEVRALGRRALAVPCDVTDSRQVQELVERTVTEFGKVDVLVNNAAGVGCAKPVIDISDEEWDKDIQTNLTSAFYCARSAGRYMLKQRNGTIINISSISGLAAVPTHLVYGVAKAGLIHLTRMLAVAWSREGVRVNAIVCGAFGTREEAVAFARFNPVGRIGEPDEIGPLVVFLASELSDYVTGEVFIVDGGMMAARGAPMGYRLLSTGLPRHSQVL